MEQHFFIRIVHFNGRVFKEVTSIIAVKIYDTTTVVLGTSHYLSRKGRGGGGGENDGGGGLNVF